MNRHVRTICAWILAEWPGRAIPDSVHAAAEALAKRRRRQAHPPRAAGVTREQRRDERRARAENVRVEVFKRDGGRCVVCGEPAVDMHHLVYGSGWRTVAESGKTCASVCQAHHRLAHAGHVWTLEALRLWARGHGYTLAADATDRRLDKIEAREAARAAGGRR